MKLKVSLKNKDRLSIIFILFMAFALMPDVISIAGHSLKGMYIILLLLIGTMAIKRKFKKPNSLFCAIFTYAFGVSLVAAASWGIDRLLINYCFGFVIVIIFVSLGNKYSEEQWMGILQKVWVLLMTCVTINNFIQSYRFVEYFQTGLDHPYISTLVTGGVNIEGTWIAILALSFYNAKERTLPLVISFGYSLLYASRAAIIADCVVMLIFIYGRLPDDTKRKLRNRRTIFTIMGIVGVMAVIAISANAGLIMQVFSRVADIGHDPGSLGRFAMWHYVPYVIERYPFGVGLGNVIPALEKVSPLIYEEDNIHNIYLQMFVEIGVIGGLLYIGVVIYWFKKNIKKFLTTPVVGMLGIYFLLCLFQFRGGETIFFSLLGIYFCVTKSKKNI